MPFISASLNEWLLEAILNGTSLDNLPLTQTISGYSVEAYNLAIEINDAAVKPVSATILAIMLVFELARISTKFDVDRELGIKLVAAAMFKSYVLVTLATNAKLILDALNEAAKLITNGLSGRTTNAVSASLGGITPELKSALGSLGYAEGIPLTVLLIIPYLMVTLVSVGVRVIVFFRFFELYMLSAFVTLPIVFAANPETKSITVGYVRRYGAVLLQAAVILVALKVYSVLLGKFTELPAYTSDQNVLWWVSTNMGAFLLAPIVLGIIVAQSSRVAKAILGEG